MWARLKNTNRQGLEVFSPSRARLLQLEHIACHTDPQVLRLCDFFPPPNENQQKQRVNSGSLPPLFPNGHHEQNKKNKERKNVLISLNASMSFLTSSSPPSLSFLAISGSHSSERKRPLLAAVDLDSSKRSESEMALDTVSPSRFCWGSS
jgi:hypothetical protein